MLMHQSRSAPMRALGLALAIAAASLIADVAAAKDYGQFSTVVNYRDLDLSQSSDAVRLYSRLKFASQEVCGIVETRDLRQQRQRDACYVRALNQAVEQVNEPKLTALHAAEPKIRLARKS